MKRFVPIFLALLLPFLSDAQFKGGFKTGLNFSTFNGPLITGDNANESYESSTGFHVGPIIQYPFSESFGLKAEVLYNQAGGKYRFDGNSYTLFKAEDGTKILATGKKLVELNITNTYLDVPLLMYGRVGSFVLEGGLRMGVMIQSNAQGGMRFSGATENGAVVEEFEQELLYNYLKDKIGGGSEEDFKEILLEGKTVRIPERVGAYFYEDKEGAKLFNRFDMGLTVGASYFISRSLYIGGRVNFGLSDITNNKFDLDQVKTEGLDLIRNADKDKNFQYQISIGFSL